MRGFARFAWGVLAYDVAVVAWGAFVRATGSGAGCGKHWPTCNGQVVARPSSVEMAIELTHRVTSGASLALVVALAVLAARRFPRGHAARRAALAALALTVVEALVGAGLVLFGWVAKDASLARAAVMPVHLVTTFLLLAALALAAAFATRPPVEDHAPRPLAIPLAALALVAAGATGAVAALGDTLFPAGSLAAGLRQDLAEGAHVLLRLRALHPVLAAAAAVACGVAVRLAAEARPAAAVRRAGAALLALVVVQVLAGAVNLLLLAPVWLQVVHVVLADLVWIALVLLAAAVAAARSADARPAAGGAPCPPAVSPS